MISSLAARFAAAHPGEAARIIEAATVEVQAATLTGMPTGAAAAVCRAMAPHAVAAALETVDAADAGALIAALPTDAAVPLLLRLAPPIRNAVLRALPRGAALALRTVLRFPAGTVGGLMDPRALALSGETTVGEAMRLARRAPANLRRYLYVLDAGQRLAGVASARDCLLHDAAVPLRDIADLEPVALRARSRIEHTARSAAWERWDLLPVIDHRGVFLGVLRRRRAREVLRAAEPENTGRWLDLGMGVADAWWGVTTGFILGPDAAERRG